MKRIDERTEFYNRVYKRGLIEADYKGTSETPYHITLKYNIYGSSNSEPMEFTCTCPAKVEKSEKMCVTLFRKRASIFGAWQISILMIMLV